MRPSRPELWLPQLSAGVPRSFVLAGQCGIPAEAQAVSLNVTVVSPAGTGYVLLYPQGDRSPPSRR